MSVPSRMFSVYSANFIARIASFFEAIAKISGETRQSILKPREELRGESELTDCVIRRSVVRLRRNHPPIAFAPRARVAQLLSWRPRVYSSPFPQVPGDSRGSRLVVPRDLGKATEVTKLEKFVQLRTWFGYRGKGTWPPRRIHQ